MEYVLCALKFLKKKQKKIANISPKLNIPSLSQWTEDILMNYRNYHDNPEIVTSFKVDWNQPNSCEFFLESNRKAHKNWGIC